MASKFGFDDDSSREHSGREDIRKEFQSLDQVGSSLVFLVYIFVEWP